jgi:hypothetical protein
VNVRETFHVSWKYGFTCVKRYGISGSPITCPVAGSPSRKSANESPVPAWGASCPCALRDSCAVNCDWNVSEPSALAFAFCCHVRR